MSVWPGKQKTLEKGWDVSVEKNMMISGLTGVCFSKSVLSRNEMGHLLRQELPCSEAYRERMRTA